MENQLMIAHVSDEVHEFNIANTELQIRSWNLFAILLSIGRPVPPIELASRCTSLNASQEFVEFVCSLPNSPLSLTNDGLVTVSSAVCTVLQRFLLNSDRVVIIRDCGRKRSWEYAGVTYNRKRIKLWPNVYEKTDQADLAMPVRIPDVCAKVHFHVDYTVRSEIMNAGNQLIGISRPDESIARMCSHIKFGAGHLGYRLNYGEHEGERDTGLVLSTKELGSKNSYIRNNSCISFCSPSTTISDAHKDSFQFQLLSHLIASSLSQIEDMKDESCLLSKKPSTASSPAEYNTTVIALVKDWTDNGSLRANNNSPKKQRLTDGREHKCIIDPASNKGDAENISNNTGYGDMIPELSFNKRNTLCCNDVTPYPGSRKNAFQQEGEQNIVSPTDVEKLCTNEAEMNDLHKGQKTICGRKEQLVCSHGEPDPEVLLMNMDMTCKYDCTRKHSVRCKRTSTDAELNFMTSTRELTSLNQKHLPESTAKLEFVPKDANATAQTVCLTTNKGNGVGFSIEQKYGKKDKRSAFVKQKLKPTCDQKMHTTGKRESIKENKEKASTISVKGHSEPREMPMFDSYIVEEEEGSGGYGTVYKARRKKDGTTFAVKYPHANANRQHVYNELKMLERFGGKNFVIKYEGSFKSDNSHCLVLEHVAHDRPEVLKREIDVFQLRWYGYCLFRALASLHKQGVVHRDIKPGNFLFSRKASKGYLIDFNLAIDLHQKVGSTDKFKSHHDASFGLVLPPPPCTKSTKHTNSKAIAAGTHSKTLSFPKNLKKKTDQVNDHNDLNLHGVMKSQGADGSGITSAKDATSTRVPSAERFREPIPCKGRKEYLNLVHEALQSPDHEATSAPALKRKRVAAPLTKLDNKFIYLTPMPLQSTGVAVAGSGPGLLKNKGKLRKEGSCVGTKGFRAPEVLLKSTYQGPKVDMWSAGVTLLYLVIGRTPFVGEPEQNIKEIAKLRGSEDLWEVAKLHDRESSFPPELFQIQSLPCTKLEEWCKQNTRRPDFLEVIPNSLIDLVNKCLTVNPRLRISAEDALRHEFFAPCFKELEKQRLLRQRHSLDSRIVRSDSQPMDLS